MLKKFIFEEPNTSSHSNYHASSVNANVMLIETLINRTWLPHLIKLIDYAVVFSYWIDPNGGSISDAVKAECIFHDDGSVETCLSTGVASVSFYLVGIF